MLSSDFIPTSDNIDGSEIVIRFLTRKEDFANIDGIEYVAVHTFYPVLHECEFPDKKVVCGLSVTRKINLSYEQILELGRDVIESKHKTALEQNRTSKAQLRGWVEIAVHDILALGLTIEKDEPPQNHANIQRWPSPVPRSAKDQKELSVLQDKLLDKITATLFLK